MKHKKDDLIVYSTKQDGRAWTTEKYEVDKYKARLINIEPIDKPAMLNPMKVLLFLLTIWCALTLNLAFENLRIKEENVDQINWRALMYYTGLRSGCMIGASYANNDYNFVSVYSRCRNMALDEKYIYLKKWLPNNN